MSRDGNLPVALAVTILAGVGKAQEQKLRQPFRQTSSFSQYALCESAVKHILSGGMVVINEKVGE